MWKKLGLLKKERRVFMLSDPLRGGREGIIEGGRVATVESIERIEDIPPEFASELRGLGRVTKRDPRLRALGFKNGSANKLSALGTFFVQDEQLLVLVDLVCPDPNKRAEALTELIRRAHVCFRQRNGQGVEYVAFVTTSPDDWRTLSLLTSDRCWPARDRRDPPHLLAALMRLHRHLGLPLIPTNSWIFDGVSELGLGRGPHLTSVQDAVSDGWGRDAQARPVMCVGRLC